MTDNKPLASVPPGDPAPPKEPTEKQAETLEKIAAEYAETQKKREGYKYRLVTSGGQSTWRATKIAKD